MSRDPLKSSHNGYRVNSTRNRSGHRHIMASYAAITTVVKFLASKRDLASSTIEGYCLAIADTVSHVRGRNIYDDP